MIRAICLNPNIDRSYYIGNFVPGVKFRNLVPDIAAGGKGVNVAKAVSCLGGDVVLYCFLGGRNGKYIEQSVSALCRIRSVWIEGESRETTNIIDRKLNKETELVEQGPAVSDAQYMDLQAMLCADLEEGDIVICSGVSINGAPLDVYATISRLCMQRNAFCFLDANGKDLENARGGQYSFWKPNQIELSELAGTSPSSIPVEIQRQVDSSGIAADRILVSLGPNGGLFIGNGRILMAEVPQIPVVSTIGCGDSVVAGFAMSMMDGKDDEYAFRFAMATGVANSVTKHIAEFRRDIVLDLLDKIQIKNL